MTTTKTKNGKPSTSNRSVREMLPGRGNPPASGRRPAALGSRGLLGRVQATLPGVKRNPKRSGSQKVVAALGKATGNTTAHKPSTKHIVGILAGGGWSGRGGQTPTQPRTRTAARDLTGAARPSQ